MEHEMESHDALVITGITGEQRQNDSMTQMSSVDGAKNGGGLAETAMPRRDLGYWRQQEQQESTRGRGRTPTAPSGAPRHLAWRTESRAFLKLS